MVKILNLEGINRVFAILEAICRGNGLTVSEVARATNISRGAANRYIYSLEQLGYILREHMAKEYFVSSKLKDLANYVKEDEWIDTIAYPIMRRVGEKVMWPLSLVTLRGHSVVDLHKHGCRIPINDDPGLTNVTLPDYWSGGRSCIVSWTR